MSTNEKINLCIRSIGTEQDWRDLYERSFPRDERMSLEELDVMIKRQLVLVHRTTDSDGNLLCFSIVTPMSNFSLLAYIATDQTRRSSGVGTKHMKELINTLKKSFPGHRGLFLEIESTRETGLSPAEELERKRRLTFYERLGCKRLVGADYLLPSYLPGSPARHGELLWFEYQESTAPAKSSEILDSTLGAVICEIYIRGYGVSHRDDSFTRVMSQFPQVDGATCSITLPVVSTQEAASGVSPALSSERDKIKKDNEESTVEILTDYPAPARKLSTVERFLAFVKRLLAKVGL